ncbi:purple acid phosphatase-like [Pyrus ussuriensis x Pyrus communis]|uniref:Purple acid phosphatase-like n=1 Tax=Pyrus ussuriensis x Pyrus communis TaxID=2448454 RepID=A0A5N5IAG4_9ROSA|nr:purple acid phosphatase-like [Pyrus ussuriensis x Pyrus communis]
METNWERQRLCHGLLWMNPVQVLCFTGVQTARKRRSTTKFQPINSTITLPVTFKFIGCGLHFWFITPPEVGPDASYRFGLIGDKSPKYAPINYPNHDNVRWDTWGRFVERSGETKPFKPYSHRYHVPYEASGSTSPFWYSIKRASAYIIVLSSYSAYGKNGHTRTHT